MEEYWDEWRYYRVGAFYSCLRIRGRRGSRLNQSAVSAVLVSTSNLLLLNFAIITIARFSGGRVVVVADVRQLVCCLVDFVRVAGLVSSRPVSLLERVSVVRLSLDSYLTWAYLATTVVLRAETLPL